MEIKLQFLLILLQKQDSSELTVQQRIYEQTKTGGGDKCEVERVCMCVSLQTPLKKMENASVCPPPPRPREKKAPCQHSCINNEKKRWWEESRDSKVHLGEEVCFMNL